MTNPTDLPFFQPVPPAPASAPAAPSHPSRGPQAHRLAGLGKPPSAVVLDDPATAPHRSGSAGSSPSLYGMPTGDSGAEYAGSADIRRVPSVEDMDLIDWSAVRALRTDLSQMVVENPDVDLSVRGLDRDQDGELVWAEILDLLRQWQRSRVTQGQEPVNPRDFNSMAHALMDSVFGIGRLERYLHQDGLENIFIRGHDNVWLDYGDRKVRGPDAASSRQELVEDLKMIARWTANGVGAEREFGPGSPFLNRAISREGHRIAAEYASEPLAVTIRRQGFTDRRLHELIPTGMIDPLIADFLEAVNKAGMSYVVSGLPGTGKTTLLRCVIDTLPPDVPFATIETEYELMLHNLSERHPLVMAGQSTPAGEGGAGEVTLSTLLFHSLRHSVDRIVVGEVRGAEIMAWFSAMQVGKGAAATIHAHRAVDTIGRVIDCAMHQPGMTRDVAEGYVRAHLDFVVHVDLDDETPIGGRKQRFVSHILEIVPGEGGRATAEPIFSAGPDGRAVPTGVKPTFADRERTLRRAGFSFDRFLNARGRGEWAAPRERVSQEPW